MQIADHLPPTTEKLTQRRFRVRWLLALLAVCAPVMAMGVFIGLHLRANFSTYVPTFGSDAVGYWHYTLTFSQVGFNGGYYVPNEIPAPFNIIHFDVIGPMFPILYGSVAHFTGWGWTTGIIFNGVLVTAALAFFVYTVRPDRTQLLLITLLGATSWMLILFLPSMFQESLHFAIGIAAAASFYQLLTPTSDVPKPVRWFTGAFIILAALLRTSWCVLLLPYFLLTTRRLSSRSIIWAVVRTVFITIVILQILKYVSPPSNNSVLDSAAGFQSGVLNGLSKIFSLFATNLVWYSVDGGNHPLNLLVVLQVLSILAVQIWLALPMLRRKKHLISTRMQPSEVFIHLSNLGGIAISGMFLYLAWGFDRVFSPHLFLSGLLLVGFRRYRFAAVLVVTNLVFIGSFLNRFGQYWSGDFTADPAAFTAQQAEVAQYIAYDSAASSPWCNTLLLDVRLYDSRVLTVPGGIGVSYVLRPDTLQFPLKSRYLLFNSPADLDLYTRLQSRLNVRLLGRLSIGDLYLNQDADC